MTNEQSEKLLIADRAGNYYLLSQEMLDQARVPEARAAEIRAELEKVGSQGDVSGFSLTVTTQAVGEESGGGSPMPDFTTLAIGEEGGAGQSPIKVPFPAPFFRGL